MTTRARILLAGVLLTPGLAGYLYDRPADGVYFVPDRWQPGAADALSLGSLGTSPPGFAQVLPFILITAAIHSLFELVQQVARGSNSRMRARLVPAGCRAGKSARMSARRYLRPRNYAVDRGGESRGICGAAHFSFGRIRA